VVRLPAGRRAYMAERTGKRASTEEGDDRRGRDVSERESRERRRDWATRIAGPRGRARARAGRSTGPSQREGRVGLSLFLFFFFKNVNSVSICLFH
jgi:hypothetical protein